MERTENKTVSKTGWILYMSSYVGGGGHQLIYLKESHVRP